MTIKSSGRRKRPGACLLGNEAQLSRPCHVPSTTTSPSSAPGPISATRPSWRSRGGTGSRSTTSRSSSAASSPKRAACRWRRGIRRGSATGWWSSSAGATARGLAFNVQPKHWPFEVKLADRFVIAIQAAHADPDPFLRRAFAAVWEEERNLADPLVLDELAEAAGLDSTHFRWSGPWARPPRRFTR